jgi:hypothetical protein
MSYDEEKIYKTFYEFVYDKIIVYDAEIEREEQNKASGTIGIIIELQRKRVSFVGYSEDLTSKLQKCFTSEDHNDLSKRLGEAFDYLN